MATWLEQAFDSIESVLLFFFVGVCSSMGQDRKHVMSDCKLATTVESLSTDGRKRHERRVFLWIMRTLRNNMENVWAVEDVLRADPSKKKKTAPSP